MARKEETTIDTIRHLKRREPFAPFRIIMTSGDGCLIDDADALAIATSQLHYYPRTGMGVHLRLNQTSAVEEPGEKGRRREG